jgi:hypothetical protein
LVLELVVCVGRSGGDVELVVCWRWKKSQTSHRFLSHLVETDRQGNGGMLYREDACVVWLFGTCVSPIAT